MVHSALPLSNSLLKLLDSFERLSDTQFELSVSSTLTFYSGASFYFSNEEISFFFGGGGKKSLVKREKKVIRFETKNEKSV